MKVGVTRESFPGEKRVALVPATVPSLAKAGLEVIVETGAGSAAGFTDSEYEAKGAKVDYSRQQVFSEADIVLQVRSLGANPDAGMVDLDFLRKGTAIIGFNEPLSQPDEIQQLAQKGAIAFSMELMPRITRAQSMDALSSMATIAGYKAVLIAADHLPRMFPMMMTAAGTISPAHVFVIGAGVAGLQAIASSKRLGAVVQAYDLRPAVKEQVQSLGGKFVELELETEKAEAEGGYARAMDEEFYRKQREMMFKVVATNDVVITTAAVPGKKAPMLVTREMVEGMKPGSVIVDLAAERGGNCELTSAGELVEHQGVSVIGPVNLPAEVPYHASQMYSKNISTFLLHLVKEGQLQIDLEDEITRETLLTRDGEVVNERVKEALKG